MPAFELIWWAQMLAYSIQSTCHQCGRHIVNKIVRKQRKKLFTFSTSWSFSESLLSSSCFKRSISFRRASVWFSLKWKKCNEWTIKISSTHACYRMRKDIPGSNELVDRICSDQVWIHSFRNMMRQHFIFNSFYLFYFYEKKNELGVEISRSDSKKSGRRTQDWFTDTYYNTCGKLSFWWWSPVAVLQLLGYLIQMSFSPTQCKWGGHHHNHHHIIIFIISSSYHHHHNYIEQNNTQIFVIRYCWTKVRGNPPYLPVSLQADRVGCPSTTCHVAFFLARLLIVRFLWPHQLDMLDVDSRWLSNYLSTKTKII